MASSCDNVVKPGRCGIPREPISSVVRVVLYLALSVADTSSLNVTSFLSLASLMIKQTVSSAASGCSVKGRWPPCQQWTWCWRGSFIAMALVLLTKLYHGTRHTCTDPKLLHIQVVEQDLSFTTRDGSHTPSSIHVGLDYGVVCQQQHSIQTSSALQKETAQTFTKHWHHLGCQFSSSAPASQGSLAHASSACCVALSATDTNDFLFGLNLLLGHLWSSS